MYQVNIMSRIQISFLHSIGSDIYYFVQFFSTFFLKLNNFVSLQIEAKFNFYINVILIFLLKFILLLNILI